MRFLLPPKRQLKVARFFGKHGTKAVFFARFFAGVRIGVYSYAGSQRMSWIKFLILDLLGALISGPTSVLIGWWCARTIADNRQDAQDMALHLVREFGHWLVLGILVLLAAIVVVQIVHKNRSSRETEEPPRRDPPEVRVPPGPEEAEELEARVGAVPARSDDRPGRASLE